MNKIAHRRQAALRRITLFSLLLLTRLSFPQAPASAAPAILKNPPSTPVAKSAKTDNAAPKLTLEQERGLRLLKAAEAEAAGLQPDMRAFVLWRASMAYAKIEPRRADSIALAAFTATQGIEDPAPDDNCHQSGSAGDIKGTVQQHVLSALIDKDRLEEVEQLLPLAGEWVRNQITSRLVGHYLKTKEFAQAEASLNQVADSKNYPYGAAADLILAMGPELSGDRMSVFHEALNNYQQHDDNVSFGSGDIGDFVERTWSSVPAAMALAAVDSLLDKAKSDESKLHYSMSTGSETLALNSQYQYRLFQLLPVLRELDKDKADELLRDNAETKAQLSRYPKGMQSLQGRGTVYSMSMMGTEPTPEQMTEERIMGQLQERKSTIVKQAAKDPAQAVTDALNLPVHAKFWSPRVATLMEIAEYTTNRKNTSAAKSALEEILKVEDQLTPTEVSMSRASSVPKMYLNLGDQDGARKAVKALLKSAEKSYASDTNADDPNKGFKGTWPSSDLWRKCVQASAQISPAMAEEIIAGIPDPDIAAAQKVAFASSLLGVGGEGVIVGECRKNGSSFSVSE
jgi:hypothetical protein